MHASTVMAPSSGLYLPGKHFVWLDEPIEST